MQVAHLRRFLQEGGVSHSFKIHRKYRLERLYKLAHEMNLEVITKMLLLMNQYIQTFRSQSPDD